MFFTKNPWKYSFQTLSAVMKVYPIPHVIFETIRSGFIQILHHCLLLETQALSGEVYFTCAGAHTCAKASRSVISCKLKSNFWLYIFTTSLPVFDHQDMCLLSCYYNTDGCHWLLNRCFVNECFDSESYWFYIEIKKVFFNVQFTSILRLYVPIGHPIKEYSNM